jgi:integrase
MAKKYKYRWRADGRHRQKTFATRQARDAFRWRLETRGEESETTFRQFAERWLTEYAAVMQAETSVIHHRATITTHLNPVIGGIRLQDVSKGHASELRATLRAKSGRTEGRLAPKTVNEALALAGKMLKTAQEWGLVSANPFEKLARIPHRAKTISFWTAEERDRFLTYCRARDPEFADLVLVAVETGLRRGELQALQRQQLDFRQRLIRVDATYSEHVKRRLERTKNRDVGHVPMSAAVFQVLRDRQLMTGEADVFDRRLFVDIYDRLGRRCRDAGVKPIGVHGLRHSFASIRVMAGVPLYSVHRLMRHKSIAMTERYAHLAPDYLRSAIETGSAFGVRDDIGKVGQQSNITATNVATPERLEPFGHLLKLPV